VTLVVIDPYLIYAHWEVGPEKRAEASHAVLRVFDTTHEPANHYDLPVSLPMRHAYVDLWTPERSCYAELGLIDEDGSFATLARSNLVRTQRAWPVAAPEPEPAEEMQIEPYHAPRAESPVPGPKTEPPDTSPAVAEAEDAPPITKMVPDENERSYEKSALVHAEPPPPQYVPEHRPVPESTPETPLTPETPHIPEAVDAARILRAKLEAIYAARPWRPRAAVSESSAPDQPPVLMTRRIPPLDLTNLAEAQFSPGISSKTSEPPA
jgi:Domain of unknown function (DUF4912)